MAHGQQGGVLWGSMQLACCLGGVGTSLSCGPCGGRSIGKGRLRLGHKVAQILLSCTHPCTRLRPCRELMLEYGVVKMIGNIVTQIIQGAWVGGLLRRGCKDLGASVGAAHDGEKWG